MNNAVVCPSVLTPELLPGIQESKVSGIPGHGALRAIPCSLPVTVSLRRGCSSAGRRENRTQNKTMPLLFVLPFGFFSPRKCREAL